VVGSYHSVQDFRECLEEDNDPEGGRRVGGGLARLVEDDTKCFLEGGGVETVGQPGIQEGGEEGGLVAVPVFPD